ncbi:ABC transporter permease [Arcobacter sp. L]|uniref:ABC transporter permease n=1 Tax=Arcobacter sp. L TaxID=944547 RepID=UPI000229656B|nr:ABC transporter permease [Arcobacter sp. L]BAK73219.1 ABC transporter permease component [Arcobacter sp. L]
MLQRLLALIKKEILAIRNDKKSLMVVIIPPLVQVIIFSFAATLEVKNIDLVLLNQDGSQKSQELIRNLQGSNYIKSLKFVKSYEEGKEKIDIQDAIGFLIIPNNFAKNLEKGNSNIQIILDGRRSNTSQIVEGYLNQIILNYLKKDEITSKIHIIPRNFYNPNLDNFWWIVPSLFCSISMVVAMILTALSIAREKELGTFEQILVSPLNSVEILLGKLLPALIISTIESSFILFVAIFLFGVPLNGSIWLLYLSVVVFLFSMSGIGLFISSISNTQQQAILGSFIVMLPSFLLSGFATPISNMPAWLQTFTDFIPLKYYLELIKGIFLKDISFSIALNSLIPMFLFGIISLYGTLLFFKNKRS